MIGVGLQKLAKQYGMKVANGIAYGNVQGYAVSLFEGAGWKQMIIVTTIPAVEDNKAFLNAYNQADPGKLYAVRDMIIRKDLIQVVFNDNPGTMKKIEAFIGFLFPLLEQYGATHYNICAECGLEATGDTWYMVNGIAFPMHAQCAENVQRRIEEENQQRKDEDTGSYVSGAIGAFLGAILGAVVWAVVLYLGYVASLVGLLIGWLAEKGYTMLKGRQGKGKVVILILAIIFGVLLGTIVPDVITLAQMISSGELLGYSFVDIPMLLVYLLQIEPEYLRATLSNGGLGLLFAALGVFSLLRKTGRDVSGTKFTKLP